LSLNFDFKTGFETLRHCFELKIRFFSFGLSVSTWFPNPN